MSAIFKRDLRSYFTTPVGYVYMAIFLAVNGGAFSMFTIQEGSDSKVASYFTTMIFALIVLIPLLTMKTFSEEKKLKTEQLLMTSPVSLGGMVLGKFLAAYTVFAGTFVIGCLNFTALFKYGPKNYAGTASEYNGAILLGSTIAVLLIGAGIRCDRRVHLVDDREPGHLGYRNNGCNGSVPCHRASQLLHSLRSRAHRTELALDIQPVCQFHIRSVRFQRRAVLFLDMLRFSVPYGAGL